jgi:hypothetical protein
VKTQLLYLDAHDDLPSTREKLRWVQADHVVLVWPSYGRILHRRLDLVLLAREAERQSAQLGILSHDPDVRQHARQLGLPTFDDLNAISRQPWPDRIASTAPERKHREIPPRPAPASQKPHRWTDAQRAASMLVVIAALLALSVVIGPAALVELSPVEHDQAVAFPVLLSESSAPATGEATIPSHRLQVDVEGSLQVPTQGKVSSPTATAVGAATFTNRGQEEVVLPEGTGLRTTDSRSLRFETTERALVPAGIGSQVVVPIRASAPGPEGNVPAEAIGAIEGTLGLQVTVSNAQATKGGASETGAGVSPADLTSARAALERQLLQQANADLQKNLAEGEALAPGSIVIRQVLSSDFRPAVGQPSEVIRGTMRARVEAVSFSLNAMERVARARLEGQAGARQTIIPASVRAELLPIEAGGPAYTVRARGRSRARVDFNPVAQAIAGKPMAQASAILTSGLELASPPRFSLWPGWWPRLPFLPLRIQPVWLQGSP